MNRVNRSLSTLLSLAIMALALGACQTTNLAEHYPVGEVGGNATTQKIVTSRYGDLPITIYYPAHRQGKAAPAVVYLHGRPFDMPALRTYKPAAGSALIATLNRAGYVVAVPVRKGYYYAPGFDHEKIDCGEPIKSVFHDTGRNATEDIVSAVNFIAAQPGVDPQAVYLFGQSAGGFALVDSLPSLPQNVKAAVSMAGGRCGKRGPSVGGLDIQKTIYRASAKRSQVPMLFVAGLRDDVVPPHTVEEHYKSFCSGHGQSCAATVRYLEAPNAKHTASDVMTGVGSEILAFLRGSGPTAATSAAK